jgi:hypothetical protein
VGARMAEQSLSQREEFMFASASHRPLFTSGLGRPVGICWEKERRE